MDQQKSRLKTVELTLLYLSILVVFFTQFLQSSQLSSFSDKLMSTKVTEKKSSLLPREFICGERDGLYYAFSFDTQEKVQAWVSQTPFQAKPQLAPQALGRYLRGNQNLKWTINIFGYPTHFELYDSISKKKNFTSEYCSFASSSPQ